MIAVRSVATVGATLGEGPVWIDGALWFVDIKGCRIHRFDPTSGATTCWPAPAQPGWVLPVAGGGLLVGLQTGVHRFHAETGAFELLVELEPDRPGNRLNDATVDPAGRLWCGSMDDGEERPTGAIYRLDGRGVARVLDGVRITNGPAVAPDGRALYHCDTLAGVIHACRLDDGGEIVGTQVFAVIDHADGYPDGPVVDAEGHLWVGLFQGWGVRRYAPDGRLVATVRLPVANVTKIAFGDDGLAYATTATKGLSPAERADQPLAGDLFAFAPGVAGQPTYRVGSLSVDRPASPLTPPYPPARARESR